jgi:hypothetical protein
VRASDIRDWGEEDRERWVAEVEASAGFAALRHPAARVEIHQEPV